MGSKLSLFDWVTSLNSVLSQLKATWHFSKIPVVQKLPRSITSSAPLIDRSLSFGLDITSETNSSVETAATGRDLSVNEFLTDGQNINFGRVVKVAEESFNIDLGFNDNAFASNFFIVFLSGSLSVNFGKILVLAALLLFMGGIMYAQQSFELHRAPELQQ